MEEKKIGLREVREDCGKSIADVAKALGVTAKAVSNKEHEKSNDRPNNLQRALAGSRREHHCLFLI